MKLRKFIRSLVSMIAVIAFASTACVTAHAEEMSVDFLEKADAYVSLDETTFVFDEAAASKILSASEMQKVKDQVRETNEQIQRTLEAVKGADQYSIYTTGNVLVVADSATGSSPSIGSRTTYHEGVTKVEFGWSGIKIYLSKTTLNNIGTGANIAGLFVSNALVSTALGLLGIFGGVAPGGIVIESNLAELALLRIGKVYWQ